MSRTFVIVGHRVRTDPKFTLNDLSGSTGRLDILLRSINSAFLLSNGIRRDVELFLVLQGEPNPPVSIRILGGEVKYLNPDERSTGALIRQAIMTERKGKEWVRSTPGIYVSEQEFSEIIHALKTDGRSPVYLHESGADLGNADVLVDAGISEKAFIVLGDQYDLTEEEESLLDQEVGRISLGPEVLHTDHCIVLIHNALDRRSEPSVTE